MEGALPLMDKIVESQIVSVVVKIKIVDDPDNTKLKRFTSSGHDIDLRNMSIKSGKSTHTIEFQVLRDNLIAVEFVRSIESLISGTTAAQLMLDINQTDGLDPRFDKEDINSCNDHITDAGNPIKLKKLPGDSDKENSKLYKFGTDYILYMYSFITFKEDYDNSKSKKRR